ncbi:MAG: hypothetical protein HZC55_23920 [Verrucomicrobia bacterium]|nr:hypothetical protein [Verrucomicrobiota bacterium]
MKTIRIGSREFSRVLFGTNAVFGRSHFSVARDAEYRARFDAAGIERLVQRAVDSGINTVESSASDRIGAVLSAVRKRSPRPVCFVGSTRIDETSEIKSHHRKLEQLIATRAEVCVIHAQFVDRSENTDAVAGLEPMLEQIHAAGLLAGISTHRVRTVELCERRGYAIDTYMFPLNATGFVYPGYPGRESVKDRIDLVRGVAKPFILMKTLAAGRLPPSEALPFVAEHAKPIDLVSIGFGSEAELDETLRLAERLF